MLVLILLLVTLILELIIPRFHDISFLFVLHPKLMFTLVAIVALVLQYVILHHILSIQTFGRRLRAQRISILAVQSIITVLMLILTVEVLTNHNFYHSTYLNYVVSGVVTVSYGATLFFLSLMAYRFLRFHNIKEGIVGLLYGFAFCSLILNAILHYLSISITFGHFLILRIPLPESCLQFEMPPSCSEVQSSLGIAWIVSFLLLWAASIMFNYRNRNTLGKKSWILMLLPVTFLLYYPISFIAIPLLDTLGISIVNIVDIVDYLFPILYLVSTIIPAFVFGASFWLHRKGITDTRNQIFLTIGGIGLFFYFLTISPSVFPQFGTFGFLSKIPYGIVLLSLAGLFAYMLSISRIDRFVSNRKLHD